MSNRQMKKNQTWSQLQPTHSANSTSTKILSNFIYFLSSYQIISGVIYKNFLLLQRADKLDQ